MNQQPFETLRHIGTEAKPDCRLCRHFRELNLFKGEFYCNSPIRCENANRFLMIGDKPLALWLQIERATF